MAYDNDTVWENAVRYDESQIDLLSTALKEYFKSEYWNMKNNNIKKSILVIITLIIIIGVLVLGYLIFNKKNDKKDSLESNVVETVNENGLTSLETETDVSWESDSLINEVTKIVPETIESEIEDTESFVESAYEMTNTIDNGTVFECKDKDTGINIRSLPQHESDLVGSIRNEKMYYSGESVEGLGSDMNLHTWYYITTENGLEGWVRSDLVVVANDLTISNSKWKQAYIDYIDELKNDSYISNFEFYLVDINGDSLPELSVDFASTAGGSSVATYNNELNILNGWNAGFSYLPGENLFCDSGGHMDEYYHKIYRIEDGDFYLCSEGMFGAEDNSDVQYDNNGFPIYNYYWNGEKVTETEYYEGLNDYYNTSEAVYLYDLQSYKYPEIINIINEY